MAYIDFASDSRQEMSISLLQECGIPSAPWFLHPKFIGSTNSHLLKSEGPSSPAYENRDLEMSARVILMENGD